MAVIAFAVVALAVGDITTSASAATITPAGGWPDGSAMLSSSYSSPVRQVGTGQGNVFGDVGGYVVLLWGGTCDLLNPSTTQKIT